MFTKVWTSDSKAMEMLRVICQWDLLSMRNPNWHPLEWPHEMAACSRGPYNQCFLIGWPYAALFLYCWRIIGMSKKKKKEFVIQQRSISQKTFFFLRLSVCKYMNYVPFILYLLHLIFANIYFTEINSELRNIRKSNTNFFI